MSGKMECCGATHMGQRRTTNEDQFLIADLNKSLRIHQTSLGLDHQTRLFGESQGKLLLVADGMGGHEAGQRASTLAVDGIATYVLNTLHWYFKLDSASDADFQNELKGALEHCQEVLAQETKAFPRNEGMGTTLTMAYLVWPRLWVVHVGDSRCYLFRDGRLNQITRDHTLAQLEREKREASGRQASAEELAPSHLLWNVIGGIQANLQPEVYRLTLQVGDTLLLCTDGLTHHLSDASIVECLKTENPLEQVCDSLIARANSEGGSDNITVAIARFRDIETKLQHAEQSADVTKCAPKVEPFADTDPFEENKQVVV